MTGATGMLRRRALMGLTAMAAISTADPTSTWAEPHLSNVLSLRPQNGVPRQSEPDTTLSTLYNLDGAPAWIRLTYLASSVPYSIDGAAIAATSAVHDGFTPVNQAGQPDDGLWHRVTFDHNGDDSSPAEQLQSAVFSLDVPARRVPTLGFSDWIKVEPMARTDGGYGFLLLARTYSARSFHTNSYLWSELPDQEINRVFAAFKSKTNGTLQPWGFAGERDFITASYGLQYVTNPPGATVIGIGDSIMAPPASIPYGMRACTLISTPERPVSYINAGKIGQRSADFLADGRGSMLALNPQVALIQTFSSNDPSSMGNVTQMLDGATRLAELARKTNCYPILVTDAPETQITDAAEALRQESLRRTRALAARGFTILDLDALWGIGGGVDAWKKLYNTDRWHPSNTASRMAAQALAPVLRGILGVA